MPVNESCTREAGAAVPTAMTAEGLCSPQALAAAVPLWCWGGDVCPSLWGRLRAQRGLFSDLLAPEALVLTALPPRAASASV